MAALSPVHTEWLDRRKILSAATRFGLYTEPQLQNGRVLVVPYLRNGEVINHKYRGPNKQFWMDEGKPRLFWNIDAIAKHPDQPLIIAEGEWDALSLIEAGFERTVSVPNGSNSNLEFLGDIWDEIAEIGHIILCGDNDAPGQAMNGELARRLGHARCSYVEFPDGCKDINDVLMLFGPEGVRELIGQARPYPVRGLYKLSDYPEFFEPQTYSTGWPELDVFFRPIRQSLIVVTGIPQAGKSKWTAALLCNLLNAYNHTAVLASFEMPVVPFLRNEFRVHLTGKRLPNEEADRWIDKRLCFIDQTIRDEDDEATLEWVLERAAAAVVRYGSEWLLIDPWNQLDSDKGAGETGEEYQRRQIKALKRFAKAYQVGVIVVAHPTKAVCLPNGKVREPTLYDISGSAHWFNACDHGIILTRPGEKSQITVSVKKCRFPGTGRPGEVHMMWREEIGKYTVCAPPGLYDNYKPNGLDEQNDHEDHLTVDEVI